jgi:hypothetical protein
MALGNFSTVSAEIGASRNIFMCNLIYITIRINNKVLVARPPADPENIIWENQ